MPSRSEQRRRSSMAKGKTFEARGRRADWETLLRQRREGQDRSASRVGGVQSVQNVGFTQHRRETRLSRCAHHSAPALSLQQRTSLPGQGEGQEASTEARHRSHQGRAGESRRSGRARRMAVRDLSWSSDARYVVSRSRRAALARRSSHLWERRARAPGCNSRRGAGRFPVQAPLFARPTEVA